MKRTKAEHQKSSSEIDPARNTADAATKVTAVDEPAIPYPSEPQQQTLRHVARRYELPSIRQTAALRMEKAVRRMLDHVSDETVHDILEESTDVDSIIHLLSNVGVADVAAISPLAAAYLRGAEMKRQLLEEAGGAYSTGEVASLLQISEQAVHSRLSRHKLLAVSIGNDRHRFPTCQFDQNGVITGIDEFIAACNVSDPWMQLALLLDPQPALGGISILKALRTDQHDTALRVTRSFAQ